MSPFEKRSYIIKVKCNLNGNIINIYDNYYTSIHITLSHMKTIYGNVCLVIVKWEHIIYILYIYSIKKNNTHYITD